MIVDSISKQLIVLDPRDWMKPYTIPNFLTLEECLIIRNYWREDRTVKSTVYARKDDGFEGKIDKKYREGKVFWITHETIPWLTDRLLQAIWKINDKCFGFNITGIFDSIQLTKYKVGDFYSAHRDCGPGKLRFRKISFTIQLSDPADYKGGILDIYGQPAAETEQGTIIIFPSFMLHKVTPVTHGERFSLVSWIVGAEWR